jgi:uncharacterized surface protein with fasciclin (FAS1) repeats
LLVRQEAFLRVVGFKRAVEEFQEYLVFTPTSHNLAKLEEGTLLTLTTAAVVL